jgi:hypothetical protein
MQHGGNHEPRSQSVIQALECVLQALAVGKNEHRLSTLHLASIGSHATNKARGAHRSIASEAVLAIQSTNMPAIGLGVLRSPQKQFP